MSMKLARTRTLTEGATIEIYEDEAKGYCPTVGLTFKGAKYTYTTTSPYDRPDVDEMERRAVRMVSKLRA